MERTDRVSDRFGPPGSSIDESMNVRAAAARAQAHFYTSRRPAGGCMFRPAGAKQFKLTVFEHPLLLHNGGSIEN